MPSRRRALPALAGFLCLAVVAGCHGSAKFERLPRPHDLPRTDARARADLLALVAHGRQTTWWVDSDFVRTVGARTLKGTLTEVNRPPDRIVVGLGGLSGTIGGRALTCTPGTSGPLCTGGTATVASDASAYATLTDPATGTYALRDAAGRRIGGLAARCFRLEWNDRGTTQPYGTRATACFSAGGIPLAFDVTRAGGGDTTTARTVKRTFTDADLDALLAPYRGAGPVAAVTTTTTTTTTTRSAPSG